MMNPDRYLPNRRPGEEIILLLRRHWKILFEYFFLFVVQIFIPLIFFFVGVKFLEWTPQTNTPLTAVLILGASLYYLYIWLFFFHHWIDYYLDLWIVTNERIFNIEQHGLFSRIVSELSIENLQDVTSEIKGKLNTLFDVGEVHIQSAGEEKRFVFEEIPHPQQVASEIMRLHQSLTNNKPPEALPKTE